MRTPYRGLVSVFLFLIAAASFAQKNTGRMIIPEAYLKFEAINDFTEVVITGGIKSWDSKFTGKVLEVSSKIQDIPVARIKDFNGSGNKGSSLWIPDSVKTIDDKAFDYLTYKSVRLPDGLTYIAEGLFAHSYIKSVTIPSSVKNIYA